MERHRTLGSFRMLLALLALTLACLAGPSAVAQQARRLVRNPVTGRLEPVVEPTRIARRAAAQAKARRGSLAMPAPPQENHQVEPAGYIDAPCDDLCCDIGCGDAVCGVPSF